MLALKLKYSANFLRANSSAWITQKHCPSLVVKVFTAPLNNNGRGADREKTPFFYCCMRVHCRRYLSTAAVYRVTA
jgi:hypothetical protein